VAFNCLIVDVDRKVVEAYDVRYIVSKLIMAMSVLRRYLKSDYSVI
jgi:hypothetical protein